MIRITTLRRSLAAFNVIIADLKAATSSTYAIPAGVPASVVATSECNSVTLLADELRERKERATNLVFSE